MAEKHQKKGVSGTKEWSSSSVNCMRGCANGCWYCYAKTTAVNRTKTNTVEGWTKEEPILEKVNKKYGKRHGTIMFPTQHDITWENLQYTMPVLLKLLEAGNKVLVVSKPQPDVVYELADNGLVGYQDQVLFRFTIGSMDPTLLSLWEPSAPTFAERLYSLMFCFKEGFQTSVSMEPLLCPDIPSTIMVVDTLYPFITDSIWIGKMNHPMQRLRANGAPDTVLTAAEGLTHVWSDERIRELYRILKNHRKIKWKESIKKIVGLEVPTEAGLDI